MVHMVHPGDGQAYEGFVLKAWLKFASHQFFVAELAAIETQSSNGPVELVVGIRNHARPGSAIDRRMRLQTETLTKIG
jgi:hypothetical protein